MGRLLSYLVMQRAYQKSLGDKNVMPGNKFSLTVKLIPTPELDLRETKERGGDGRNEKK